MFSVADKIAYSPGEFAALFGKERTWTYRQLSAGKIKCIKDYGRTMIPASEAERIAKDTSQLKVPKKAAKAVESTNESGPKKLSSSWSSWVSTRKTKVAAGKRPAKRLPGPKGR